MPPLHPIRFKPIYKAKVWGGRTLERLGRRLPGAGDTPEGRIGESWELADLASTSPSGGGGEAAESVVAEGPHAGKTLHTLIDEMGEDLIGTLPLTEEGRFPLLVKFLDARENLSVQVHPSPAYAAEHPEAHLKSEAWYIVAAEPGAVIYKGVKAGTTRDMFLKAIEQKRVEELMLAVPAVPGECHYLPSGTCHALGAGILVAEVQTPSDTTFRVYDWDRTDRELHVAQALQCIDYGPPDTSAYEPRTRFERQGSVAEALVHCEHFRIEKRSIEGGCKTPIAGRGQPVVWTVISGAGAVAKDYFTAGQTFLLPAALPDPTLHAQTDAVILEISFPQAGAGSIA